MFDTQPITQSNVAPQAAVLFKSHQWNHEIENASERLRDEEAKAIKEKVGVILNLVSDLSKDIMSKKLTSNDAKHVCQEIMFLAGCYRVRAYPGVKDALYDLSSLYHQYYNATKAQPNNAAFNVSEVSVMA